MFESLGRLVIKNIGTKGGGRSMKAAGVLGTCPESFKAILGQEVGGRTKALSFKAGVLSVECEHSTDAEEVRWHETEIMGEINKRVGDRMVSKIRLR